VIINGTSALLEWYRRRRRKELEGVWRDPAAVQERTLLGLVDAARDTEFGLAHGFDSIRSVEDYQARVPVREYRELTPLLERALQGEQSILWPGRTRDWIRTAGTTSGAKIIPLTSEALSSLYRAASDALLVAVERGSAGHRVGPPMLVLGGTITAQPIGGGRIGDLCGFLLNRLPPLVRGWYSPGPELSGVVDWEQRIDAIAAGASRQDLRLLWGMPSWLVTFFERVARHRERNGRRLRDLGDCWPNLKVVIHGGVSFGPYAAAFDEWIGRPIERVEVYPAAEGFVGVQTERSGGLTLMLDHGIFYEFVPVDDLGSATPRRHTVADVELGRSYAVVLSTPAGLWSYVLGDTVRFTRRDPLRFHITGRTRHYVNILGEHVTVEEVERALVGACRRTEAEVVEFTVAPRVPSAEDPRAGLDWLVEFCNAPQEFEEFARILDETLASLNAEYRARRIGDHGMVEPRVTALPAGTFRRWMRGSGALGHPHKVPRVTNHRVVADAVLAVAGDLGAPGVLAPVAVPTRT
jgi:hypothetical protein